jgi:hypothetical protein
MAALAGAECDWKGLEVHPVHETVCEEGLDEVAAAVRPEVRCVVVLQLSELRDDVPGDAWNAGR